MSPSEEWTTSSKAMARNIGGPSDYVEIGKRVEAELGGRLPGVGPLLAIWVAGESHNRDGRNRSGRIGPNTGRAGWGGGMNRNVS
jgi:hypothetical protein